ncbi:MAG: hypothetical protein D6798_18080 [Deltaproteobacteria bacterium]|nr:MAG: hypothetical protein D6798_18080 [Deltaproteobacteria bacterium]
MIEDPPDEQQLVDLGRVEAVLAEMRRAGRVPVVARGIVPLAELAAARVALFGEAGGVQDPAWEGWLSDALTCDLVARHGDIRRARWDADHAAGWSVAWTDDDGPPVIWTAEGGRLRLLDGTVDVLDGGRWVILPASRIVRITLARVHHRAEQAEHGVIRLHTDDGRQVSLRAGRMIAAGMVARHLAEVLGVAWTTSRWDG